MATNGSSATGLLQCHTWFIFLAAKRDHPLATISHQNDAVPTTTKSDGHTTKMSPLTVAWETNFLMEMIFPEYVAACLQL